MNIPWQALSVIIVERSGGPVLLQLVVVFLFS